MASPDLCYAPEPITTCAHHGYLASSGTWSYGSLQGSVCSAPCHSGKQNSFDTQDLDLRPWGLSMRNSRTTKSILNSLLWSRRHSQVRRGALGFRPSSLLLWLAPTVNVSLQSRQSQVSVSLCCRKQSQTREQGQGVGWVMLSESCFAVHKISSP